MEATSFRGYGNIELAADIGGNRAAPAVILMHGGGQTRYSWGKAAQDLVAAGFYVISLDLRGHGGSAWAPDGDYAMDAFVGDVRAVAATLPSPPALVGASLGGAASLMAVGETGERIASALVLVDVVPHMEPKGMAGIRNFMSGNADGFASLDEVAAAVSAYMPHRPRPSSNAGLLKNLRKGDSGRLFWHWDPAFMGKQRTGAAGMFERMDAAAKTVRIPTLLVRGKASEVVSTAGAEHLQALIPQAEAVDVEGAGHMVAGDKNDAFNAAVIEFLNRTLKPGLAARTSA